MSPRGCSPTKCGNRYTELQVNVSIHSNFERDSKRPPIDLLRPFEPGRMIIWACNPLVGSVKNNGPEMLNSA